MLFRDIYLGQELAPFPPVTFFARRQADERHVPAITIFTLCGRADIQQLSSEAEPSLDRVTSSATERTADAFPNRGQGIESEASRDEAEKPKLARGTTTMMVILLCCAPHRARRRPRSYPYEVSARAAPKDDGDEAEKAEKTEKTADSDPKVKVQFGSLHD